MYIVGFKDGTVNVLDNHFSVKLAFKHAKEWISAIKISPKNDTVAIGSHDNVIYIYSLPEFKLLGRLNKHSSFITHIDFNENG